MATVHRFPGVVRQLGIVVLDLEASMRHWLDQLHVGPFFHFEKVRMDDFRFRGAPCEAKISAAFANAGPLQIELIEALDDEPSSYREFLAARGEGLQHIAYWTQDFDEEVAAAGAAGYRLLQSGRSGGDPQGRHAYFDSDLSAGPLVELSEIAGPKGAFFRHIEQVAASWDGSEPIRRMDIRDERAVPAS